MDQHKGILNSFILDFPQVEIKGIPSPLNIEEGYTMFLTCEVRSNPEPCSYTWFKNQKTIGEGKLYNKTIEPEDVGSYTCRAINTVGPGESQPILISVKCKFLSSFVCHTVDNISQCFMIENMLKQIISF